VKFEETRKAILMLDEPLRLAVDPAPVSAIREQLPVKASEIMELANGSDQIM
jgi:hypothetical protein